MLEKLDRKAVALSLQEQGAGGHLRSSSAWQKHFPLPQDLCMGVEEQVGDCCHVDGLMLPASMYAHLKQERNNDKFSFLAGIVYVFS